MAENAKDDNVVFMHRYPMLQGLVISSRRHLHPTTASLKAKCTVAHDGSSLPNGPEGSPPGNSGTVTDRSSRDEQKTGTFTKKRKKDRPWTITSGICFFYYRAFKVSKGLGSMQV